MDQSRTDADRTGAPLSRRGFLAVAAGAAAAVPLVAGCGGGGGGSGLSSTGKPVKGGPKTTPNKDVVYPDGYVGPIASMKGPITTERARLKIVVPQDANVADWNTNVFTKWYEKRTNVQVDFQIVGGGGSGTQSDTMTKVNAMIASGDLPDAFMVPFTPSQVYVYGSQQKTFRPLEHIVQQYCPEAQRMLSQYPDVKKTMTTPDGHMYALPFIADVFHVHAGNDRTWIYKPWLEKLGLKMPTTLDEFEHTLEMFKTHDLNGKGAGSILPMVSDSQSFFDQFFMGSFMYCPPSPWLMLNGDTVEAAYVKDGWRSGLQYLNRLYGKGLIAKQSFTQSAEQLQRLGNASTPEVGVFREYYWGSFMTINQDHPAYLDWECLPMLNGPSGKPTAAWDYYSAIYPPTFVVTTASKIPEIATMWADGLYEMEATIRADWGVLGRDWHWAKQGDVSLNGGQASFVVDSVWPPAHRWWGQDATAYQSNDFRLSQGVNPKSPTYEKALYEQTKSAYYPYRQPQSMQLPPLYMTTSQTSQVADLATTINNYVTQSMAGFITGKQDPNDDGKWNSYLSTLKKMGLPRYLDIYSKAYQKR